MFHRGRATLLSFAHRPRMARMWLEIEKKSQSTVRSSSSELFVSKAGRVPDGRRWLADTGFGLVTFPFFRALAGAVLV